MIRWGVNSPIDQYFVDHGAGLLAALRVWGKSRRKTEADIRALIDLADAVTLENLAEVLAHSHDPDDLHASVQLEAIGFATATPAIPDTRLRTEGASTELIRPRSAWPVHHRDLMTKAW
jgi:hypothetical protein